MYSLPGKWNVFDTSIYIAAIQRGIDSYEGRVIFNNLPHTYLSSVVSGELHAGCVDNVALKLVKQFTLHTEKTGRTVTPTHASWNMAGTIIARIIKNAPNYKSKTAGLFNDILIIMTAIQIGATVYTANREDFLLIRKYRNFSLKVIDAEISE